MKNKNLICHSCGQLAAQMKEASGGSYRQYDQLLQKLMELHYTVCHYMRCRSCGALYFVGACIRGAPVFRQVADIRKENLDTRLWGRCGTYYLQKKD